MPINTSHTAPEIGELSPFHPGIVDPKQVSKVLVLHDGGIIENQHPRNELVAQGLDHRVRHHITSHLDPQ